MNPPAVRLNPLDERIVHALAEDARRSYADIGAEVGLSAPAVKRRVDRLRAEGAITGFTVRVDPVALGWQTEGFVELYCRRNTSPTDIHRDLSRYPEVVSASTVTGEADAIGRSSPPICGASRACWNAWRASRSSSALSRSSSSLRCCGVSALAPPHSHGRAGRSPVFPRRDGPGEPRRWLSRGAVVSGVSGLWGVGGSGRYGGHRGARSVRAAVDDVADASHPEEVASGGRRGEAAAVLRVAGPLVVAPVRSAGAGAAGHRCGPVVRSPGAGVTDPAGGFGGA